MKAALLIITALLACKQQDCHWSSTPDREDLRACNMARAGGTVGGSGPASRFYDCMRSLGYTEVCVDR